MVRAPLVAHPQAIMAGIRGRAANRRLPSPLEVPHPRVTGGGSKLNVGSHSRIMSISWPSAQSVPISRQCRSEAYCWLVVLGVIASSPFLRTTVQAHAVDLFLQTHRRGGSARLSLRLSALHTSRHRRAGTARTYVRGSTARTPPDSSPPDSSPPGWRPRPATHRRGRFRSVVDHDGAPRRRGWPR